MDDSKLIFTNCYYNGERFALLWFDERDRMLLTNGYDAVYEGHFKIEARQKMLGNIAKSLLEHKWRKILNEEALLITRIDNDTLTLSYVLEDICLTKVTKNIQERIRNVKHGGVVSAKNTINPNPRETDDAMIVENTHNWISNKSPQRKIVKPLFTQNEKQNNSNINSLLGENSNYGSGTVLKRKDDLSTVQIMRKEYDHSNEKTSTDRRASVVIFDKSNTGAAILSASSFSKDSHDYSPVDISALEEVLKRDDFLNHCPTDNDFLLGVNKRCYKLFIPDTVGHSREEKCQMFSSELLQLTSDLDVFAIKKLYKSLSKVKHFYIFAGFKCLDQHTCIDLKTNGIIEFSIKVEKLPCFGVYSLADAEWHCIEEDISGNTKLPFICEKRDTYRMLECKKHDHIRLIDNKCYNKRVYTNPYSRNVGDQICADYAMHLPVIDDNLKQRAISKQMSHFESNLWLGLRCKVGETLSTCKWGNNQPLSYNNFGTSINSISAGECVYLDKKTLQWIATDCSTKFYILCQSDE